MPRPRGVTSRTTGAGALRHHRAAVCGRNAGLRCDRRRRSAAADVGARSAAAVGGASARRGRVRCERAAPASAAAARSRARSTRATSARYRRASTASPRERSRRRAGVPVGRRGRRRDRGSSVARRGRRCARRHRARVRRRRCGGGRCAVDRRRPAAGDGRGRLRRGHRAAAPAPGSTGEVRRGRRGGRRPGAARARRRRHHRRRRRAGASASARAASVAGARRRGCGVGVRSLEPIAVAPRAGTRHVARAAGSRARLRRPAVAGACVRFGAATRSGGEQLELVGSAGPAARCTGARLAAERVLVRVLADGCRRRAARDRRRRPCDGDLRVRMRSSAVGLERGADRDRLLGVDVGARRLAEELGDLVADVRDLRRAADEDDVVDLVDRRGRRARAPRWQTGNVRSMMSATCAHELVARDLDLQIERLAARAVRDLVDRARPRASGATARSSSARRPRAGASSRPRCVRRSMRFSSRNFSTMRSTRRSSRSSPPRNVSPAVPSTS